VKFCGNVLGSCLTCFPLILDCILPCRHSFFAVKYVALLNEQEHSVFEEIGENFFVKGGHWQVQTSKYFNSITSNQHCIAFITRLKECLEQCDKFYAEVMFNLSKKVAGIFSGFIETVELYSETVEIL